MTEVLVIRDDASAERKPTLAKALADILTDPRARELSSPPPWYYGNDGGTVARQPLSKSIRVCDNGRWVEACALTEFDAALEILGRCVVTLPEGT